MLAYLAPAEAAAALDAITDVAVPASMLAKTAIVAPADDETYRRMPTLVGASASPSAGISGVGCVPERPGRRRPTTPDFYVELRGLHAAFDEARTIELQFYS